MIFKFLYQSAQDNSLNKIINLTFIKLISISLVVLLSACVASGNKKMSSNYYRAKERKIRPSESMQAGVPKNVVSRSTFVRNETFDEYNVDNNDNINFADDVKLPTVDDEYVVDDLNFSTKDLGEDEEDNQQKIYSGH